MILLCRGQLVESEYILILKKIFLTGGAGFVGYHLAMQWAQDPDIELYIIDNLNSYYDVRLKYKRLENIGFHQDLLEAKTWLNSNKYPNVYFLNADLSQAGDDSSGIKTVRCDYIIHLAAQAGVRYSFENPDAYMHSNVLGFYHIMELAKTWKVRHFIFASSSSVYGGNDEIPFLESHSILKPLNLYAATKASNELLAYAYASLYHIPSSALRFFTVYGPYGRPDMAYFKFLEQIYSGAVIEVFGNGELQRDFTHVNDIVKSMIKLLDHPPDSDKPFVAYNIGNNKPIQLLYFIRLLEKYSGRKANLKFIETYNGEMKITYANIDKLSSKIEFTPQISIEDGLYNFVEWYNSPENPLRVNV